MIVTDNLFIQLSIVILIAIGFSGLMRLLKQPMIIGYILTGIAVSPYVLNFFSGNDNIATFGQVGVSLLLFMVGLNLNPHVIKELGRVSIITGVGQLVFTAVVGYFIGILLGFSPIVSLYISVALTNSSTIIILKLLSDKGDLDKLYAKIAVGFLIVQDIIAIFILMVISSSGTGLSITDMITVTVLKGVGVLFLLFIVGMYVLPTLLDRVAKSQEFLLLFSIGWCLILAAFLLYLDFSMEIGALLAGITLSLSPYRYEISAKMKPLRDFFIVLFFILLGSQMEFTTAFPWKQIVIFSLFILIGNPLILMIIMGLLGYTKRTGFMVGLTVAQVSEFTFIMVALGVKMGHVPEDILSFVTVIGMITIAVSTYMIIYADFLYGLLEPLLGVFERKKDAKNQEKTKKKKQYDIFLFGYNNMGFDLLRSFRKLKKKFLIIDYDPEIIARLSKKGYDCLYGDAADPEIIAELDLAKAKLIISTIADTHINAYLLAKTRQVNKKTGIILLSNNIDEALHLYKHGATYVVLPHLVGGTHTSRLLTKHGLNMRKFIEEKMHHVKVLRERRKTHNILQFKRIYRKFFVRKR